MKTVGNLMIIGALVLQGQFYGADDARIQATLQRQLDRYLDNIPASDEESKAFLSEHGDKLRVSTDLSPYERKVEYAIVNAHNKEQLRIRLKGLLQDSQFPVRTLQNAASIVIRAGDHTILIRPGRTKDISKDGRPGFRVNQDGQCFVVPSQAREAFNELLTQVDSLSKTAQGYSGSDQCVTAYLLGRKVRLIEAEVRAAKGAQEAKDLVITMPIMIGQNDRVNDVDDGKNLSLRSSTIFSA
jgi:hypothetical protein